MKNFLITGASGFIGNNFLKEFSNKNNLYYILLKNSKKIKNLKIHLKSKIKNLYSLKKIQKFILQ